MPSPQQQIVDFVQEHQPVWRSEIRDHLLEQGVSANTIACALWRLVDAGILDNDNYRYSIAEPSDPYTGWEDGL